MPVEFLNHPIMIRMMPIHFNFMNLTEESECYLILGQCIMQEFWEDFSLFSKAGGISLG